MIPPPVTDSAGEGHQGSGEGLPPTTPNSPALGAHQHNPSYAAAKSAAPMLTASQKAATRCLNHPGFEASDHPKAPAGTNISVVQATARHVTDMHGTTQPAAGSSAQAAVIQSRFTKSFRDVASSSIQKPADVYVANLNRIQPMKKGDAFVLVVPDDLYEERLRMFQHALIGRLILPKGAAPRATTELQADLVNCFKNSSPWSLNPLGRGYFSLKFSGQEDQAKVARIQSWKLEVGAFHIREWKPFFDPYKEQTSTAQIWVRMYHMPEEFWHPKVLAGAFRAVGNVIKIDGCSASGRVGHFARALVEIDLACPLLERLLIDRGHEQFFVEFSFEKLPSFCSNCKFVGHTVDRCRASGRREAEKPTDLAQHRRKTWVRKEAGSKKPDEGSQQDEPKNQTLGEGSRQGTRHLISTANKFAVLAQDAQDPDQETPHLKTNTEKRYRTTDDSVQEEISGADLLALATVPVNGEKEVCVTNFDGILEGNTSDMPFGNYVIEEISQTGSGGIDQNFIRTDGGHATVNQAIEEDSDDLEEIDTDMVELEQQKKLADLEARMKVDRAKAIAQKLSDKAADLNAAKKRVADKQKTHAMSLRERSKNAKALSKQSGKSLHEQVQEGYEKGATPAAFVFDPGEKPATKALNVSASKRWSDLIEENEEEAAPLNDEDFSS